ncbi:MAG: GntR family transcriptional regulator [Firmicutes bacterium]|nr:GntR family transcriptional regulator [Bacillota bacterium]
MSKKFLYKEIIDYLEQLIEKNKMIIKYRMPSENQLATKFDVSRITAKNAINNLVESGKLFRRQGKGTFIVNPNFDAKYNSNLDNRASIGLMLPNFNSTFITDIVKGISAHLDKIGMPLLILHSNNNQDTESFLLAHTRNIGVIGLIVLSVDGHLYNKGLLRLALSNFPMVFLDRIISGVEVTSITSDHFQSSFDAFNYLSEYGHRYIGFIRDTHHDINLLEQRYKGYEQAMIEKKISLRHDLILTIENDKDITKQFGDFLTKSKYMTAVIISCSSFHMPHLFEAVTKYNIRVPDDISIIVYDNEWFAYKNFLPFTPHYIDQRPQSLGHAAAQTVVDIINSRPPSFRNNTVSCKLIEGNSVKKIN